MQAVTDNVFRALADPTRRAIFEGLTRDGEQTVHALTRRAGSLAACCFKTSGYTEAREAGAPPARGPRNPLQRAAASSGAAGRLDGPLWSLLARPL